MPVPPDVLAAPTDVSGVTATDDFMEAPYYGAEVCLEPTIFESWLTISPVIGDPFVASGDPKMTKVISNRIAIWKAKRMQKIEKMSEGEEKEKEKNAVNNRTPQCFDYAQLQLQLTGFDVIQPNRIRQIYTQNKTDAGQGFFDEKAVEAAGRGEPDKETEAVLKYVMQSLSDGRPVLAGLRIWGYPSSPNKDLTTNHFVVIIAMGKDLSGQAFLRTFDSGLQHADKPADFFLRSNLTLETFDIIGGDFRGTMSQIWETEGVTDAELLGYQAELNAAAASP